MTPSQLSDAVAATPGKFDLRETPETLVFHAPLTGDDRAMWLSLKAQTPRAVSRVSIIIAGTDTPLESDMDPVPGEVFRVSLLKTAEPGCLCLFLPPNPSGLADVTGRCQSVRVAVMSKAEIFTTLAARFEPWTDEAVQAFTPADALPDPRGIVKDFTSKGHVPSDIRPWLIGTPPEKEGETFKAWAITATERLLSCLADQVSLESEMLTYHFTGPPRRVMSAAPSDLVALTEGVQAAAQWVYAGGRDAEPRHLLLANEWARAAGSEPLQDVPKRSLDSAKVAYVAFVRSSSKETLQALADLRKGVVEETQKASQRTQDLAGALWKDLAIASAPFVLKVLPDSAKAANNVISALLAFAAAMFLLYSFLVQTHINKRYFRTQRAGRIAWRGALGTILSKEELEDFGEKPISDSIKDYEYVRNWVGAIYAILVIGLLWFGLQEALQAAPNTVGPPSAPPTPQTGTASP